jgi:V/A-type H+-transporting ATPase subunit I
MGLLRPVAMSKVGVIGLRDDRERVLNVLHDLRLAQIESLPAEALAQLLPERATDVQRQIGDEALRFRGLRNALPPVPVGPPRILSSLPDILAAAKSVTIDAEVGELKREDDRLTTEEKAIDESVALLAKLSFYPDRLENLRAKSFVSFFGEGTAEARGALRAGLPPAADPLFLEDPRGSDGFLIALRTAGAEALARSAQSNAVRLVPIPALSGTPSEEVEKARTRRAEVVRRRVAIVERLGAISRDWFDTVAAIDEALQIENRKVEILSKLGAGRSTFALEAWVPTRDVPRLETIVQSAAEGRAHLYRVSTHDEPPTLMENPPGIRRFEFFIRFYSLPQATEWDPTLTFAIVFPIFFALMLGDWGYGLTILLICIWMIRGFPGVQRLPKFGRTFVGRIMGPSAMQSLAYALLPGTILAIALGLTFDEFFGVHVSQLLFGTTPIADPLRNLPTLLLIAGFIGLAMVTFGFLLGALKEYFHHHPRGALGKVGGIAFAWGIVGFGLQVIHFHTISPPLGPILAGSLIGLIVGAVLLVVGEGVQNGVMALIEVVSHVLSYTRLVGILLASVVLAIVINDVAQLSVHSTLLGPFIGIAIAVVIVLIGQSFNVILGVFEPGIQGARLIFVEHFSKFYTGNGKPFRPFGAARTHTVSTIGPDGTATVPLMGGTPPVEPTPA